MTDTQSRRAPQRRSTRIVTGAIALTLVSGAVTAAGAASATADAPDLDQAFTAASSTYGVPRAVLAAVSYAQTRWDQHSGSPSVAGGWGPMHLVDATLLDGKSAPPRDASLAEAARLTGLSPDALRSDLAANVAGGAALLADAQRTLGNAAGAASDVGAWYAAVAAVSGSTDETAATSFADDVYATIASGESAVVDGKAVTLRATSATVDKAGLSSLKLKKAASGPTDCPNSLSCEWIPAPYSSWALRTGTTATTTSPTGRTDPRSTTS